MFVFMLGAALGPLLAGLLSAGGWDQVFYMLMTADFLALLVRANSVWRYFNYSTHFSHHLYTVYTCWIHENRAEAAMFSFYSYSVHVSSEISTLGRLCTKMPLAVLTQPIPKL